MDFMDKMSETLNPSDVKYTENGAKGFGTTGHALLDLNFSVSSLRNSSPTTIINKFIAAYDENSELAVKWLFFLRDIREGLGERDTFRLLSTYMADCHSEIFANLIKYIPEYGRWDDVIDLIDTDLRRIVFSLIKRQLKRDQINMATGNSVSLLAKWMPSVNASSWKSRRLSNYIAKNIRWSPAEYRRNISELRKYMDVVEVRMSAKDWSGIEYASVPSRAMNLYSKAFRKHDEERYIKYLNDVAEGKKEIHTSTLYPHEITGRINRDIDLVDSMSENELQEIELKWQSMLKDKATNSRTLVVRDGSFSMESNKAGGGKSSVTCDDVATALTLYFAEMIQGEFHNKFVTFSNTPRIVDLNDCETLISKIYRLKEYFECANTNVEAVFNLILATAIQHRLSQDELPDNILILSDMEFDRCVEAENRARFDRSLFDTIRKQYEANGYKLPRITFWNINSRTETIPMKENDLGCCLVSGFSPNIAEMVMNGETDPYQNLVNVLMSERYRCITIG